MGYPPGGFPRTLKAWVAIVHPEDKARVMAALEDHLMGAATYVVEYRVERRDGKWRWWSARGTALRDDRGKPYKMIGSITDITEHKQVEAELFENEYLLSQPQQLAHIGSWSWDLAGPFKWSEETYRIYGVSRETFIPTTESLTNLIHPEDRP